MSKWKKYNLGEVITLNYGKSLPAKKRSGGDIPVYSSAGLTGWHDKALVDSKGLIIGRKGTIGKVYKSENPFYAIDTSYYVLPNNDVYDFDFLFFLLGSIRLDELNEDSAVPGLNRNTAYSQEIFLPSLPEQRAIASVLSSLDDKIDLLHRQNKTLEAMAETLFRQWFIEEVQEDCEEKPLSFYGNIVCGKTPSKKKKEYFNGGIPFIKIPDMHGNIFVFQTSDSLSEEGRNSQSNKTLPAKSICVSCIATVGLVSITVKESQTNQQINSIVPYKNHYCYYLYLFMKNFTNLLTAMASGGTATLNLNTSDFSKIKIPLPDKNILKECHKVIEPLFNKIFNNQKLIRTLEQMRDVLLPKLMSGEVRCSWRV